MTPYDDTPAQAAITAPRLIDGFGRAVTYLRVSVTDRCDFRCVYCMSENMTFLPKAQVLTLEELDRIAAEEGGLFKDAVDTMSPAQREIVRAIQEIEIAIEKQKALAAVQRGAPDGCAAPPARRS